MTVILAAIHAFGSNPDFTPTILYVGTIMVDLAIAERYMK